MGDEIFNFESFINFMKFMKMLKPSFIQTISIAPLEIYYYSEVDLGATLVCQSDPTRYKSDPKSTSSRRLVTQRLEATWARNNRLSTSSRLLTWHTAVYLRLLC